MKSATYRAYGRTVRVVAPASVLAHVADRLHDGYRAVDGAPDAEWRVTKADERWRVSRGPDPLAAAVSPEQATEMLLSDLELWVAEHAARRVFVHAGCVVHDGRAIVLPGRTMSGKSSLTAALVRAGATYYSDEYAVVDARGFVRPYPRNLAIRPYDGSANRRVHVGELGGTAGSGPVTVGLVALLRYDAGIGWHTEPLTRGQTVLHLIDNAVAARSRPRAVLSALGQLTETARGLLGTRDDADATAARLIAMLHEGTD